MTESSKPQQEFTPWGMQDLPDRTLHDMAVGGLGAAMMELVPRADGGEDIVMKHVDIRIGPMPTEAMDAMINRRAHQDNARHAEERRQQRELDNEFEALHAASYRREAANRRRLGGQVSLAISAIGLGAVALAFAVYGAYLAIHWLTSLIFG